MTYSAAELEELKSRYPLSSRWGAPELYSETARVGSLELAMAGFSAAGPEGALVTGSAAQLVGSPVSRAYFELLERAAVLDARAGLSTLGHWDAAEVFPESPEPARWRYSLSNGVAAQRTYSEACRAAELELIERDHVLRYWESGRAPRRLVGREQELEGSAALSGLYEPCVFLFGTEPAYTVGAFAFPRGESPARPFVYGFSARPSLRDAIEGAWRECLQRLAFLWGEDWSGGLPEFSPTPDYHQEFYLRPVGIQAMREWLFGTPASDETPGSPARARVHFHDLTPAHLAGRLSVVRAVSSELIPLYFGLHSGYRDALHPFA